MCLQPGDILRDRYKILKELGRGGFGVTYLARDLKSLFHPLCAIKEIPFPKSSKPQVLKKARDYFEREADALKDLGHHPQIPQFFDRFDENRHFYLVQKYIKGQSLAEELTGGKQWSQEQVVTFLRDILKVLKFVHRHGVIHRDLKPSNLIRRKDNGPIVLIDFGAVREISSLDTTNSGTVVTTRAVYSQDYTPPEQRHDPDTSEPYNDIYAVGIIAAQALTGLNPNQFPTDRETLVRIWHFSTPNRPMVTVDPRLEAILNKMIRYLFNQRYESVEEILEDLQDLDLSESVAGVSQRNDRRALTTRSQGIKSSSRGWNRSFLFRWGWLAVVTIAATIALDKITGPKTDRFQIGDSLSVGEEILLTNSSPFPKKAGVNAIARCRSNGSTLPILLRLTNFEAWQDCFGKKLSYEKALKNFKLAWNDTRDPETLIYLNNTFLETINADYYTISVAVPIRRDNAGNIINSDLAREILRGVAQAQLEVNLAFFERYRSLTIDGAEALPKNAIAHKGIFNNGTLQGLRVIITDDGNQVEQSKSVAVSLGEIPDLLGNIGHYASDITIETLDIYEANQLITISPGSTSSSLAPGGLSECSSKESHDFFLRTIYSTSTQAAALVDFLIQNLNQTQAAVFYNQGSSYSYCFWKDFEILFKLKGGTIAFSQGNLHKTDEFNAVVENKKVRARGDIAIVLMPDGEVTDSVDNAIEMLVANGDRNWILGGWALYNQRILQKAAQLPSRQQSAITVPWHPLTSPNAEFTEAARQLWGKSVSGNTALAYDAARALVRAIQLQKHPTRLGMQQTLRPEEEEKPFSAMGATGEIRFNPYTGNRKSLEAQWVRIVACKAEEGGLVFVPFEHQTAAAAGLQCLTGGTSEASETSEASGAKEAGGTGDK